MKHLIYLLLFLFSEINACTGIKLIAEDGSLVHGRTLEFGIDLDLYAAMIPRGYSFRATTPLGVGLRYKSKYSAIGSAFFEEQLILDGVNEKGLSIGTFYFPGFAGYTPTTKDNQSKSLSPIDFPNWILTQFDSVNEVREALQYVVIAPTVALEWGATPPPFHYIVFDKDGNCLVIEPLGGALITYDNELGTFTNSPNFDWHLTNLRNYIHLSTYNATPVSINGLVFNALGQGSGMTGLPGDFTPPSRFIRAAIFSAAATPAKNANAAIFQLFHILNQFDIPFGLVKDKTGDIIHSEYTQATTAIDPSSNRYYFKTYNNQEIKLFDLNDFDVNCKDIKMLHVSGNSRALNISSQLK